MVGFFKIRRHSYSSFQGRFPKRPFGSRLKTLTMNQFRLPLNKNIIISNKKTFWEKLIQMKKDGGQALQVLLIISSELQVISDFDYTLSTFYLEGTERNPSCHGILERCPFFPDDYRAKTKRLQVGY